MAGKIGEKDYGKGNVEHRISSRGSGLSGVAKTSAKVETIWCNPTGHRSAAAGGDSRSILSETIENYQEADISLPVVIFLCARACNREIFIDDVVGSRWREDIIDRYLSDDDSVLYELEYVCPTCQLH
jgi:hypothetical protein